MRRLMLVGLLALALPTLALASSIDNDPPGTEAFTIQTGNIVSSLSAVTPVPNSFSVGAVWRLAGDAGTIQITFSTISGDCTTGAGMCIWTGTVIATGGSNSIEDSVFNGTLTRTANTGGTGNLTFNVSELSATLTSHSDGSVVPDSNLTMDGLSWCATNSCMGTPSGRITTGSGQVDVDASPVTPVIPEPGTLGLLGTGLIGLAGLARSKFKLWT